MAFDSLSRMEVELDRNTHQLVYLAMAGAHKSLGWFDNLCLLRGYLRHPHVTPVLIGGWWAACLNYRALILASPLILATALCVHIKGSRFNSQRDQITAEKRLHHAAGLINDVSEMSLQCYYLYSKMNEFIPQSPEMILKIAFLVFPVWFVVIQSVPFSLLLCSAGTLIIVETSPLYREYRHKAILYLARRLLAIRLAKLSRLNKQKPKEVNKLFKEIPEQTTDPILSMLKTKAKATHFSLPNKVDGKKIQLYENQCHPRWQDWQPTFSKSDPHPWTDNSNKSARPKSLFELPSPTLRDVLPEECESFKDIETKVCFYWEWENSYWSINSDSPIDSEGWSYGDSNWTQFQAQRPFKWSCTTRRRLWQRTAILNRILYQTN